MWITEMSLWDKKQKYKKSLHKLFYNQVNSNYGQLGLMGLNDLSDLSSDLNNTIKKDFNNNLDLINFTRSIIFRNKSLSFDDNENKQDLFESEMIND